jgi:tetratricopeptide (TPR) repeat protein
MQRSLHRICGQTLWTWKSGFLPAFAALVGVMPAQSAKVAVNANRSNEISLVHRLERHPGNGDLWFDLGVVRAELGESGAAMAAFQHAATLLPDKLAAYRNVVALAIGENDFLVAISTCGEALVRYPSDVELLQNYAYVLLRTSHFKEATGPLSTLQQVRPSDVAVRISLISALRNSGDAVGSEAELNALFAKPLLSREQTVALVEDYKRQHQAVAARETMAYLAQRWPDLPMNLRQPVDARSTQTAASVPEDSEKSLALTSSIRRAAALIESEKYLEAMQFLVSARAQFPNQPDLEYQSALTDVCLQRYAEAVVRLQRMKQQGLDAAKVEFLLGGALEISGELQNADSAYRAAIAAAPANFMYYRALGALLQKEGTYRESSDPLQKALTLQPDDSGTLILLAKCRERAGDGDGAISLLEHAIRSDPGSRRAHTALAELYFKRSRLSDAEKEQAISATLEDERIQQWTIWGAAPQVKN